MTNFDKLHEWYRLRRGREFMETHDKEAAWDKIQSQIKQRQRMRIFRRWGSIAASVLILGGVGLWWASSSFDVTTGNAGNDVVAQNTGKDVVNIEENGRERIVSVPMGSEYSQLLADGTKVVINAATRLTYPQSFDEERREVELVGEAYFEVAHDAEKPFVVNTPSGTIEVLGTQFDVIADADKTTVTLAEGSVRLRFGDREFLMKPGEHACMHSNGEFDVRHVNTQNYTSWSTGVYEFTDASLDEITRQIALWYGVKINISDEQLAGDRFTGVIMRNESLDNALNMLSMISDLKFDVHGKNIDVKHN